ncbi:MAG: porin [Pseudomonadota bacterium]
MRKIRASSTALALLAAAAPSNAAEWELGISGFYHLGVALSDGAGQDGLGVVRDGEVHFEGELQADNGLTFFAVVELEAQTDSDQIDKNYGGVMGAFGSLKFGGDDTAIATYNNSVIGSPGSKVGYYDADAITTAADDMAAVAGGEQGVGVHYDTPEFMGFQAGVSYLPNVNADGAADTNNPVFNGSDYWSVAAAYNGEFDGFGFGVNGGYADEDGADNDVWAVGAFVSASGFTLAGGYQNAGDAYLDGASAGETFYIGAEYSTGPWTVAGGYSNNDFNDTDVASAWATYALAPGISATAGIEYADDSANEDIGGIAYMSLFF